MSSGQDKSSPWDPALSGQAKNCGFLLNDDKIIFSDYFSGHTSKQKQQILVWLMKKQVTTQVVPENRTEAHFETVLRAKASVINDSVLCPVLSDLENDFGIGNEWCWVTTVSLIRNYFWGPSIIILKRCNSGDMFGVQPLFSLNLRASNKWYLLFNV